MTGETANQTPIIVWFRRDLRLADNPALHAAAESGRPVIPLFILDETEGVRFPGAAGLWWLDKSMHALGAALEEIGSRLILKRGEAAKIVKALVRETGAGAVYWNRLYDTVQRDRDAELKTGLTADEIQAESFNAALLNEPWEVQTKTGGPYHVYTPFWRTARGQVKDAILTQAPKTLAAPRHWPKSDALSSWALHPAKPDWSKGFYAWTPGEAGAQKHLHAFTDHALEHYPDHRDLPAAEATSRLSPHLHWGEIGPRQVWRAVQGAAHRQHLHDQSDKFLSELGWREFNHHLLFERPDLPDENFKAAFDTFPWRTDKAAFTAWTKGQTGYPMVDAGMRELWTTGYMENRVRMIAASFLIKHLLIDWRKGEAWFWDTLLDADLANNVMNWQWVAGSGADASPFFRIFNPIAQGEKFDPKGDYVRHWVPELAKLPAKFIHAPWTAPAADLKAARIKLGEDYPKPIVEHEAARRRALAAFQQIRGG